MDARGVTVAIILFNGKHHLPYCLEAVSRLAGDVAEVLVVDSASEDGGPAWLREHRPDVRLIELGENRGPCTARNRALAEAATTRVLLLDCDVAPRPRSLAVLMQTLDAHPECPVVQPRAVFADDPGRVHYDGGWFSYTGLITLRNFGAPVGDDPGEPLAVDAVISMALLVDRDRLAAVDGLGAVFDDLYFIYFEDVDLSYRLRMAGRPLYLAPAAEVLHREGTAGVSFRAGKTLSHRRAVLLSRNRWVLLLKTCAWRTLLLTLPAHFVYEGVQFVFLTAKGEPHGWLAGKLGVLRDWGRIMQRRRAVMALRTVRDRDLLGFRGFSFIPLLEGGFFGRLAVKCLDAAFGAYWKLVRWLV